MLFEKLGYLTTVLKNNSKNVFKLFLIFKKIIFIYNILFLIILYVYINIF